MSLLGSIAGTVLGGIGGLLGQKREEKLQKEFAQNSISWRVQDAERAGVHPLYAIGAPSISYSPTGVGNTLAGMGQDIGRAISSVQGRGERVSAYDASLRALQLERGGLENELLRSQIRKINQPGTPPASPGGPGGARAIDGQGDAAPALDAFGVKVRPRKSENPHMDWENEYGEASNVISGARLLRDGSRGMDSYIWNQFDRIRRGLPNDLVNFRWRRPAPSRRPARSVPGQRQFMGYR